MSEFPSVDFSSNCPTTLELQRWLEGNDLVDADIVATHLPHCQRCQQSLATLTDDVDLQAFVDVYRSSPKSSFASEPEFTDLHRNLLQWTTDGEGLSNGDVASHDRPPFDSGTKRTSESGKSTFGERNDQTDVDSGQQDVFTIKSLSQKLPPERYLVDRLIATGGAGSVYLAFDKRLQREVAIKVLARNSLRDRKRFEREARVLAELEHPNIVRVFDFGTLIGDSDDADADAQLGRCYLVMEYVSGGTANRVGADQPDWAAGSMDFPHLANLMATAADGLAAAHARGLVHRDVKPGNLLLVADMSALKVADFGIARMQEGDATQLTRTGELIGTPVYMSPEQVTADTAITPSSDIYSLGATLYQLLTGIAPYHGGPAAVLRQIVESSPVAPRLILPSIPSDLETICVHAMQTEPSARYATMEQFAGDLRSFARGEPILARPISGFTKAVRFLRRNKSFAAAVATCAALISVLIIGSITAAIVFRNKNEELRQSTRSEMIAKRSAEDSLKASITAADELLLAVTTETEFLPRAPGSQEVTRKLLERARDYFSKFLETNRGNPALTYQLARAHAGLAKVAMRVGDIKSLERETEAALTLFDQISKSDMHPAKRASLRCDAVVVLANYLTDSGEAKRSMPMLEAATDNCRVALETSIGELSKSDYQDLRDSYAIAKLGLANAMTWVGKRDDALPHLTEARSMFEELRVQYPSQPTYLRNAAACNITLGTIALDQNRAVEGKQHLIAALQLLEQVGVDDVTSLRIRELKVKVLTNLALAERRTGNNVESKARYESVIAEARRLIELEPGVPSHSWNLVVASLNSGGPDMELGNLEPLVERWRATLPVLDNLIANDPSNRRYQQVKAMLQSNIAIILRDLGKLEEAIEPLKAATETLLEQAAQLDFASESYLPVALNHYELASTLIQLKRFEEAVGSLDESDSIVAKILEKDPDFTPAKGHLLDSQHSRFQVQLENIKVDPKTLLAQADRELQLARELAMANTDVAEYQIKLPRALNDYAELQLKNNEFAAVLDTLKETRTLLDKIQEELDQVPDKPPYPPEYKACRKSVLLIEAHAIIGLHKDDLEKSHRLAIDQMIERAREFGASDEELEGLVDKLGADKQ
jgi:serine/threonine protein kinase